MNNLFGVGDPSDFRHAEYVSPGPQVVVARRPETPVLRVQGKSTVRAALHLGLFILDVALVINCFAQPS
jgi:hypothetical protein